MNTEKTTAISIKNLYQNIKVGFRNKSINILQDINLNVHKGEILGFIGGNGAGKSTTIKTLIGILSPTKGSVEIFGKDPRIASSRSKIGYLPEVPRLPQSLTAHEILRQHATLHGIDSDNSAINDMLTKVSMLEHKDKRIGTFSKGMQQRIAVACALIHNPELLIFDEPMSGLDPMGRRLVRNIMLEQKAMGKSILFSSHILSDVEVLATHIALLHKGRLMTSGPLSEVLPQQQKITSFKFTSNDASQIDQSIISELKKHGEVHFDKKNYELKIPDCEDVINLAKKLQNEFPIQIEEIHKTQEHLEDVILKITQNMSQ